MKLILDEYDYRVIEDCKIRRIGISFNELDKKKYEQLNLFEKADSKEETILEKTISNLKNKFGKNTILRCISLDKSGTARDRNRYIGGHNAE